MQYSYIFVIGEEDAVKRYCLGGPSSVQVKTVANVHLMQRVRNWCVIAPATQLPHGQMYA